MLKIRNLAADGVDLQALDVQSGECVAITGPSGSGKSRLLRAIVDLDRNEGDVSLNGTSRSDIPGYLWRRKVGLVPAESGWWADTVGEHFVGGKPDPELLERLGLSAEVVHWAIARLSTGERQRLALARAMSLRPAVLLLDEPTAALDQDSAMRVEAELQRLLAEGLPMIVVTHDTGQADRLASRHYAMLDGRLQSGKGDV